jgi:aldose 1-epimerase
MVAQIINYGGRLVNLWVPDRNHNMQDVVTGFNSLQGYLHAHSTYFGALIGRYGNRIAGGKFTLDGKQYQLALNNGANHLHGGPKGFHNVVWDARQFKNEKNEDALELKYFSKDGEEGYPGNLSVTVVYTLTSDNGLQIKYSATTDKATPINLTHHSFFNLHGFSSGKANSINTHELKINGSYYLPTDEGLIPTGEIFPVRDTPMDFTKPVAIGSRLNNPYPDLLHGGGYDHNWILDKHRNEFTEAAVVYEPGTGIEMHVWTDQPGLQFYGGNFLNGQDKGKYGEIYNFRTSIALETQHYPDSPKHSDFPSVILRPGKIYKHVCVYKFEVR